MIPRGREEGIMTIRLRKDVLLRLQDFVNAYNLDNPTGRIPSIVSCTVCEPTVPMRPECIELPDVVEIRGEQFEAAWGALLGHRGESG
jgi:hypothetical protein